jgi:hypothetical protein
MCSVIVLSRYSRSCPEAGRTPPWSPDRGAWRRSRARRHRSRLSPPTRVSRLVSSTRKQRGLRRSPRARRSRRAARCRRRACSNKPRADLSALVNAPCSWPNSTLSISMPGIAAQLMQRMTAASCAGRRRGSRGPCTSLPVPVSPWISTAIVDCGHPLHRRHDLLHRRALDHHDRRDIRLDGDRGRLGAGGDLQRGDQLLHRAPVVQETARPRGRSRAASPARSAPRAQCHASASGVVSGSDHQHGGRAVDPDAVHRPQPRPQPTRPAADTCPSLALVRAHHHQRRTVAERSARA